MLVPALSWLRRLVAGAPGPANDVRNAAGAAANRTAYEAAAQGRRLGTWYAPGSGPASTVASNLVSLRNRVRAGYRNIPWITQAVEKRVSNEVGCGIVPRCRAEDEEFREAAQVLWARWTAASDPAGELDLYGQVAQIARTHKISGECFARLRWRRLAEVGDRLPVPLQLQVLEPDHVPVEKTESLPGGGFILNGIEFDNRGHRMAFWTYPEHPAERTRGWYSGMPLRVPAADMIHHFLPVRPGQVRGEPISVSSLVKTFTFDSYDDAELVRKQTRAPYTGMLTRQQYAEEDYLYDPFTGEPLKKDAGGVPTLDVQPGTILQGLPGETFMLFGGDDTGAGYADFMRQQLLAICAGHGVPYELVTGDWSKVNDRLVRQILQEFRRAVEAYQDHLLIHQVCRVVWEAFIDAAVWCGALAAPGYADGRAAYLACEWRPHAWPYIHPEQDVNAKLKSIEGKLTSRSAVVAESGWDAADVDADRVADEVRERALRKAAGLPENAAPAASAAPPAAPRPEPPEAPDDGGEEKEP